MTAADARLRGYRSAWSDPDHVRLAMERSPWDKAEPADRYPLPDDDNPWLLPAPADNDASEAA